MVVLTFNTGCTEAVSTGQRYRNLQQVQADGTGQRILTVGRSHFRNNDLNSGTGGAVR